MNLLSAKFVAFGNDTYDNIETQGHYLAMFSFANFTEQICHFLVKNWYIYGGFWVFVQ